MHVNKSRNRNAVTADCAIVIDNQAYGMQPMANSCSCDDLRYRQLGDYFRVTMQCATVNKILSPAFRSLYKRISSSKNEQ